MRVLFSLVWSNVLTFEAGLRFSTLLHWVESKVERLIRCPLLSNFLDPLSLRRDVGALSLL